MSAHRALASLALLLPVAALAYTPAEDAAYLEAYHECRDRPAAAPPAPGAPQRSAAEIALEYVDGDPRDANFHAYSGCKDALEGNPLRTVIAVAAAPQPAGRDGDRDSAFRLPGLGEYTWVFFADLLLGAGVGAWSWRRKGSSGVAGAVVGGVAGFTCFGAAFIFAIFTTFLFPSITPLVVFGLTAPLTALLAYGRPDGSGAGALLP